MVRILGIDYSLNGTGLSIYDGRQVIFAKVFTTIQKHKEEEGFIFSPHFNSWEEKTDWVCETIVNCSEYDYVAMEDHIGKYFNWMDGYGVMKHLLRKHNKKYIMVSPPQLKKYAGDGKADKDKMTKLLQIEYGFEFSHLGNLAHNVVDATWLAILGYNYLNDTKLSADRQKIIDLLRKKNMED